MAIRLQRLEQERASLRDAERRDLDSQVAMTKAQWQAKTSVIDAESAEIRDLSRSCERYSEKCEQLLQGEDKEALWF